jgi:uncharacterized iron-regulated membrane protein
MRLGTLRSIHRTVGLAGSLCMLTLSATGFVLALKAELPNVRPPTRSYKGEPDIASMVHPSDALQAATALGLDGLEGIKDVGRFEYHAKGHVYKVLSKTNYHEVQVDGATGEVVQVSRRNDQMFEDIHDLSFLHPSLRTYVLPFVAASLFVLGVTGVWMYFVPVVRRARFRRSSGRSGTSG